MTEDDDRDLKALLIQVIVAKKKLDVILQPDHKPPVVTKWEKNEENARA